MSAEEETIITMSCSEDFVYVVTSRGRVLRMAHRNTSAMGSTSYFQRVDTIRLEKEGVT